MPQNDPRLGLQVLPLALIELQNLLATTDGGTARERSLQFAQEAAVIFAICNGKHKPLCQVAEQIIELVNRLTEAKRANQNDVEEAKGLIERIFPVLTHFGQSPLFFASELNCSSL